VPPRSSRRSSPARRPWRSPSEIVSIGSRREESVSGSSLLCSKGTSRGVAEAQRRARRHRRHHAPTPSLSKREVGGLRSALNNPTPASSVDPDALTCGVRVLTVFPSPPLLNWRFDQRRSAEPGERPATKRLDASPNDRVHHTSLSVFSPPSAGQVLRAPAGEPDKSSAAVPLEGERRKRHGPPVGRPMARKPIVLEGLREEFLAHCEPREPQQQDRRVVQRSDPTVRRLVRKARYRILDSGAVVRGGGSQIVGGVFLVRCWRCQ
jgi:hypothetical protein